MSDCPLDYYGCDGSGWIPTTDPFDGDGFQRCACRYGRHVAAGLLLASKLEAEARYYPTALADVGKVAHRLRVALGMIPR